MRIAFAANPALGHVLPLVPLATAAREAGHDVAVIGGAAIGPVLAAHGLGHVEAGPPNLPAVFAAIGADGLTGPRLAVAVWSRGFAEVVGRPLAHALLALAQTWRPDLLVHDDSEQGTWIAAERLGIPHVALQATAWRGSMLHLSAEPAGRLREELGLPPDPALVSWHRFGFLATRPPGLLDPSDPLPASATPMRAIAVEDPGASVASWLEEAPAQGRRIAVTLGTVAPDRRAPLLSTILDGVGRMNAEVVVALGPGLDPASFLPRRANVRLVSFVPMAADQPANAAACLAAGAARVVEREAWTVPGIRSAVEAALADPSLGEAAGRLRSEIEAMPLPYEVLPRLEALAGSMDPR